jgi:hypothetical protein
MGRLRPLQFTLRKLLFAVAMIAIAFRIWSGFVECAVNCSSPH